MLSPSSPPRSPAEKSITLPVLYKKYCDYLTESNLIKVRGLLIDLATDIYLVAERDIYLENPEIKIRVRADWAGAQGEPRAGGGQASCPCIPAPSGSLAPQGSS